VAPVDLPSPLTRLHRRSASRTSTVRTACSPRSQRDGWPRPSRATDQRQPTRPAGERFTPPTTAAGSRLAAPSSRRRGPPRGDGGTGRSRGPARPCGRRRGRAGPWASWSHPLRTHWRGTRTRKSRSTISSCTSRFGDAPMVGYAIKYRTATPRHRFASNAGSGSQIPKSSKGSANSLDNPPVRLLALPSSGEVLLPEVPGGAQ
jgi:hypothetical protein